MTTKRVKSKNEINAGGRVIVPDLVPRDPEVKYVGPEPLFAMQPDGSRRTGAMVMALNWYGRFYDRKMAKEQLCNYLDYIGQRDESRLVSRADEKQIIQSYGWLARMHLRGLDLTETEVTNLNAEIQRVIKTVGAAKTVSNEKKSEQPARSNVQEIMRERAREAAGDLEGILDEFISAGAKTAQINVNAVGPLSEKNVLPQHVSMLTEVWQKKLKEFNLILEGGDKQLNEAYAHYSKHQIKAVIKFIEAVIAGLSSYISVKKAARAPRARKAVSPEKQASKIKFMKTYEDAAQKLSLTSLHPGKIIGATEVWAYDTVKRKLHYYVADSHAGTMGVKGTAIVGFDSAKSGIKTLRKPGDILKKLMSAGKPAARKLFAEINAVQAQPNGRTNDGLIILKVN